MVLRTIIYPNKRHLSEFSASALTLRLAWLWYRHLVSSVRLSDTQAISEPLPDCDLAQAGSSIQKISGATMLTTSKGHDREAEAVVLALDRDVVGSRPEPALAKR